MERSTRGNDLEASLNKATTASEADRGVSEGRGRLVGRRN